MAEPPRVSVVIPCYNGGADLPGALDSIRAQTIKGIEIVVVDDGSDDAGTLDVLNGLGAGITLMRQKNRGLSAARNAGMAAARGDFLLPLDCDDRLAPDFLEKTLAALAVDPDAAYAFSHIGLEGTKQGNLPQFCNFYSQLFLNRMPYCLLFRRATWEKAGGYDESMRDGYEDWELNIRMGAKGLFGVVVPVPLFRYRVAAGGMLQSLSNRRHAQLWRAIQQKHPALYRGPALRACRRHWRDRPTAYPAFLLQGLLLAHRLLPGSAFNRMLGLMLRWGASTRVVSGGA